MELVILKAGPTPRSLGLTARPLKTCSVSRLQQILFHFQEATGPTLEHHGPSRPRGGAALPGLPFPGPPLVLGARDPGGSESEGGNERPTPSASQPPESQEEASAAPSNPHGWHLPGDTAEVSGLHTILWQKQGQK